MKTSTRRTHLMLGAQSKRRLAGSRSTAAPVRDQLAGTLAQDGERVKAIRARIPTTHLVMHGSSSVPQDWVAIINQYGCAMCGTYGVPVEEIVEGIKHRVRKVN